GRTIYETRCQTCHGPNGEGSAGGPPALAGRGRFQLDAFRQIVIAGRAKMPAFADLNAAAIAALHAFLDSRGGSEGTASAETNARKSDGPIVASGGAPGGLDVPVREARYSPLGGPPYPDGVSAPPNRYYTDWG